MTYSRSPSSVSPTSPPPPLPPTHERFMIFYVAPGVCECWKDVGMAQAQETVNRLGPAATALGGLCVAVGTSGATLYSGDLR